MLQLEKKNQFLNNLLKEKWWVYLLLIKERTLTKNK